MVSAGSSSCVACPRHGLCWSTWLRSESNVSFRLRPYVISSVQLSQTKDGALTGRCENGWPLRHPSTDLRELRVLQGRDHLEEGQPPAFQVLFLGESYRWLKLRCFPAAIELRP
jgi:hypothetical protein